MNGTWFVVGHGKGPGKQDEHAYPEAQIFAQAHVFAEPYAEATDTSSFTTPAYTSSFRRPRRFHLRQLQRRRRASLCPVARRRAQWRTARLPHSQLIRTVAAGSVLDSATIDASGTFTIQLASPATRPMRLTVSGGSFLSEMDGATINEPSSVSILLASGDSSLSGITIDPTDRLHKFTRDDHGQHER